MVSFKELHEADFSGIRDAADAWSGVAKSLTSLDDRVTKDLTSTAQRAGWQGTAADGATKVLQGIDGDFKQASKVATALASIMKAAAEDFAAARRELDTAIHDAQTDKMTVTADGVVNWTLPKEARNDTDGETLAQGLRSKAEAIFTRLTKAVEKATAADQRATGALRGDVGSSTTSFNPAPYGGGPVADAALDHADADNKTVDWQAKMTYHAIGGVVGLIPEFGDAAQRLVDVGTSMWADSAKGEIDTHLKGDLSSHFSAGRQQLDAMLNYKLVESGYDHFALDGDGSVPDQLKRSAGSAYNTGIDNTYRTVFGRA
ncbi:hypothetical protein ACIRYZ_06265 [Kitasatospora sp. NPDC101155]|uniref:hypothetical protein n=1 Tax=Kitasatospora sp. NPDC101155 TaxID=3364097 RepID=UPI00380A53D5